MEEKVALKVNEIFHSIQGESSYAGLPCVFVRLTGCNLRCTYCDTPYAYEEGSIMEVSDIFTQIVPHKTRLVEITGGEPLLQPETPVLIESLIEDGYEVLLETNGTLDIGGVDPRCVRIVDVKCPSSGMAEKNDMGNLARLSGKDELKFVLGDREDYDFAKRILSRLELESGGNVCTVNFSGVYGRLDPGRLAEWMLQDHLPVRLNLQLHKWIWGPDARGV
jgi:7-carboxy-7-deazaguanine synthase